MKLTILRDWRKLSKKEQSRLTKIYGDEPSVTKTLHDMKKRKGVK